MHHLKIMESLGGDLEWVDRFFGQHAAFFYYWVWVHSTAPYFCILKYRTCLIRRFIFSLNICSGQNEVSWQCFIGPEWNVPDISKSCLQLLRAHRDARRWVVGPSMSIWILLFFLKAKKCHISWCDWVEPVLVWYCLFSIPFGYLLKGFHLFWYQ